MEKSCPFCGQPLPHHDGACRVPQDLDRFERVYDRLNHTHLNSTLRHNLMRYLVSFGRRAETRDAVALPAVPGWTNSATTGAW